MVNKLNQFLDVLANFIALRKGLIPLLAIGMVLFNFILRIYPGSGWLVETDIFLHIGVITGILGFMVAWAL